MRELPPPRPNRLEIDLDAIAHNLAEVRRLVGSGVQIITALKANAYGFGLGPVAEVVVSGGANGIAVADLADAAMLRARGIEVPILLYASHVPDSTTVAAVESYRLMPTVVDEFAAQTFSSHARETIKVFVKVDVGLERLGVVPAKAVSLVRQIRQLPNLQFEGLYTHVDVPGAAGAERYIGWQLERYEQVCDEVEGLGINIPVKMAASSAVLRAAPGATFDAVDPGHVLFGLSPPGPVKAKLELKPALISLTSRLIHVRAVDRTEFTDLAPIPLGEGMRFGVIPIGLRDGMASLTCGEVLIRGRRVCILGAFSLEHTRIHLSDVPEAQIGDEVVLIGRQEGASIEPEEVVEHQGFGTRVELALAVRSSVPRAYRRLDSTAV